MCDKSYEPGVDKRISDEIFTEFSRAAKVFDVESMNKLHEEWMLFFKGIDKEYQFVYAKVINGDVILPDKIKELIRPNVKYKYILKDIGSIYLVESSLDTAYMEEAINDSNGKNIDEKQIYIKETITIDDKAQNVFNWDKEDIAVIYIISDLLRIDRFELDDVEDYDVL